jgi:hypothetical protein
MSETEGEKLLPGCVWIKAPELPAGRRQLLALDFIPSRHERWYEPEQEAAELATLAEIDAASEDAPETAASGPQGDEKAAGEPEPLPEGVDRVVRVSDDAGGADNVNGRGGRRAKRNG